MPVLTTTYKCPFCGADGQEYQLNCTKCGKELPRKQKIDPISGVAVAPAATKAEPRKPEPEVVAPTPSPMTRPCPICGRPMGIYADQCDYCRRPEADYSESQKTFEYARETEMPVLGGVLILIAGIAGLIFGLSVLASAASVGYSVQGAGGASCCGGLLALFGLIAIAGSFSAIGRTNGMFAIIGGIFGILSIGFFLGAALALVGIILVAISYNEFPS